jgi:hypothetical protein
MILFENNHQQATQHGAICGVDTAEGCGRLLSVHLCLRVMNRMGVVGCVPVDCPRSVPIVRICV